MSYQSSEKDDSRFAFPSSADVMSTSVFQLYLISYSYGINGPRDFLKHQSMISTYSTHQLPAMLERYSWYDWPLDSRESKAGCHQTETHLHTHTEMMRNWLLHDAVAKEKHQVLSRSNHRVIVKERGIPNRAIRRGTLTASSWPEWPTRIGAAPTSFYRIIHEYILHHGAFMNSNKLSAIQWPELKSRYRTIQQSEFRAGFSCTRQSNMKSKTLGHLGPTGAFH